MSWMMRDELVNGKDVAVYWIEHVLRFNGTNHLKLASSNMPFYQLYLLDVGLLLFTIFLILFYVMWITVRFVLRCIMPNRLVQRNHLKIKTT